MRATIIRLVQRLQRQPRPVAQPVFAAAPAPAPATWTTPRTGGVHWSP